MHSDREAQIRHRAYEIWEEEGRPEGREHEHWHRAERETEARAGAKSGPQEAAAAKPVPDEAGEPPMASSAAPRRRPKVAEPVGNGAAARNSVSDATAAKPARRSRRQAEATG